MPVLAPPPLEVVQKGTQVRFITRVLNRMYLRLFTRYRRLPKVLKNTAGKAILAFLVVLAALVIFLNWWTRDQRRETAEFYMNQWTTVRLILAGATTFSSEMRRFGRFINLKTNAVERHVGQVRTHVDEVIAPQIRGVNTEIDRLRDRMENPQTGAVPTLHGRITQLRDYLLAPQNGLLVLIGVQINELWRDMYHPTLGRISFLQEDITALTSALFHPTTGAIPYLETNIGYLLDQNAKTGEWLTPVMQAVPGPVFAAMVPTLLENIPKLRAQCRWDTDDIEQLLDILLILPSLALLLVVAEEMGHSMGELAGEITDALT